MRKIVILIVISLVLALLQSALLPVFWGSYTPNLVLAFILALVLLDRTETALRASLVGGVMLDLIGNSVIGFSAFILVLLLVLLGNVRKYLFKGWLLDLLLVFVVSLTYASIWNGYLKVDFSTFFSTVIFCFIIKRISHETNSI